MSQWKLLVVHLKSPFFLAVFALTLSRSSSHSVVLGDNSPEKTGNIWSKMCSDSLMWPINKSAERIYVRLVFISVRLWRSYLVHLVHPSIPSPTHSALPQPRATGLDHSRSREVIKIMQTSLMWTWPILKPHRGLQTWLLLCHTGLLPAFAYMTYPQHTYIKIIAFTLHCRYFSSLKKCCYSKQVTTAFATLLRILSLKSFI